MEEKWDQDLLEVSLISMILKPSKMRRRFLASTCHKVKEEFYQEN
jgi:hypothetical protein